MSTLEKHLHQVTKPYILKNVFVIRDLPASDQEWLIQHSVTEERKRGEILFRKGTFPKGAYILEKGIIKIFQGEVKGERQTMYIYSSGDLIGFRQLIAEESNPVTAQFLENSQVRFIPADAFMQLLSTSPFFAKKVLMALAREFTIWMNRMTIFMKFPVKQRLMLALFILHEQYKAGHDDTGAISMTRTDISEYVGASLETLVRTLNSLKSEKLVQVSGRKIIIANPAKLIQALA